MRIIIVCDDKKQRVALVDSARAFDLTVVGVCDSQSVYSVNAESGLTWLVDVDVDDNLAAFIEQTAPACVLMGLLPAPFLSEVKAYEKWQRRLGEKLGIWTPKIASDAPRQWRYVVLLGASMGGVDAIKAFLDALPATLPITLVIAHHFDDKMLGNLPRLLARHNDWDCRILTISQRLSAGSALIVPTTHKVVFDGLSRAIVQDTPWAGEYRPNIGEILRNLCEIHDERFIAIIFSGMGADGSQYLKDLGAHKSQLWAQDPATCGSPSQPQALIDSGHCDFVGDVQALAMRLTNIVGQINT